MAQIFKCDSFNIYAAAAAGPLSEQRAGEGPGKAPLMHMHACVRA